jgi:hypothetical protein
LQVAPLITDTGTVRIVTAERYAQMSLLEGRRDDQCSVPPVNALPQADVRFYDGRAAAMYILCIRKEVLAMFAHRQTPPGVAL